MTVYCFVRREKKRKGRKDERIYIHVPTHVKGVEQRKGGRVWERQRTGRKTQGQGIRGPGEWTFLLFLVLVTRDVRGRTDTREGPLLNYGRREVVEH